jgi:hypothetical protein
MVVCPASDGRIQTIDDVGSRDVALLEVRGAMGTLAVAADDVEGFVAVVARVARAQGARASVVAFGRTGGRGCARTVSWRAVSRGSCPSSRGRGDVLPIRQPTARTFLWDDLI